MERLTSSAYEEFIAKLVRDLRARHDIVDVNYGPKNRMRGASGVVHQIDVSFIEQLGDHAKRVLIECKSLCTGRKINLGHVKILRATAEDLHSASTDSTDLLEIHLIASVPLQAGAARYAKHYEIHTQVVGDQGNWSFKYGSVAQFGLALQGAGAVITGSASKSRRCGVCGTMFPPVDAEKVCEACQAIAA